MSEQLRGFVMNYDLRKNWRIKLQSNRNKDKDHTGDRYTRDAKVLNRAMRIYKVEGRKAAW